MLSSSIVAVALAATSVVALPLQVLPSRSAPARRQDWGQAGSGEWQTGGGIDTSGYTYFAGSNYYGPVGYDHGRRSAAPVVQRSPSEENLVSRQDWGQAGSGTWQTGGGIDTSGYTYFAGSNYYGPVGYDHGRRSAAPNPQHSETLSARQDWGQPGSGSWQTGGGIDTSGYTYFAGSNYYGPVGYDHGRRAEVSERSPSDETLAARQDWGQPGSGDWQTGGGIDTSGYTYFAGSNYYGPVGYDHGRRGEALNVQDLPDEALTSRQDWGQPGSGSWQTGGGIDTSGFTYFAGSNYYGPVGYDHGRRGEVPEELSTKRPSSEDTLDSRQDWGQPGSGDWQTGGGIDTSGFTYFAGSNNYGPYGYDHGRRGDLNVVRDASSDEALAARQDWGQAGSGDWQTGGGIDTSGYTYFSGSNYYGPYGYDHGRRSVIQSSPEVSARAPSPAASGENMARAADPTTKREISSADSHPIIADNKWDSAARYGYDWNVLGRRNSNPSMRWVPYGAGPKQQPVSNAAPAASEKVDSAPQTTAEETKNELNEA